MTTLQTIATSPSTIRAGCQKCQELTATVTSLQGEAKVLGDLLTSSIDVIKVIQPEYVTEGELLDKLNAFVATIRHPTALPPNCGSATTYPSLPPHPEKYYNFTDSEKKTIEAYGHQCAAAEREACASISPNNLHVSGAAKPHEVWTIYRSAIIARNHIADASKIVKATDWSAA